MKPTAYKFIFGAILCILFAAQMSNAQSSSGYFSPGTLYPNEIPSTGGRAEVSFSFFPYNNFPPPTSNPAITKISGDVYFSFVEMSLISSGSNVHIYKMILQFEPASYFWPRQATYEFKWGSYGGFTLNIQQAGWDTGKINPSTLTAVRGIAAPVLTHQGFADGVPSRQWQKRSMTGSSSWTNISGATGLTYSPGLLTESTMFRVKITGFGLNDIYSDEAIVTVTDYAGSISPASQTIDAGISSQTLRHFLSYISVSRQWQKSTDGSTWTNIAGATQETYSPGVLPHTTYFRVKVNGLNIYSQTAVVTVKPVGGSISPATQSIDAGETARQLVHNAPGVITSRQWQLKTGINHAWGNISGATNASYSPGAIYNSGNYPLDYYYRVKINGLEVYSEEARISIYPISSTAVSPTNTENYTVKYVLREAKTLATLPANPTTDQAMPSVTYYDGLGRPKQHIEVGAGPVRQDIVTPIEYDAMGRADARQHLPYNGYNGGGRYRTQAMDDKTEYYASHFGAADAARSFVENKYEASPLNRVSESYRPGSAYSTSDKKATVAYGANAANEVRKIVVSGTSSYTFNLSYYPVNSLNKVTTTNEDGAITHTFTDFRGNTVLERIASDGGSQTDIDTYYAYDDRGLLCMVMSPEGSSKINISLASTFAESNTHVQNYAYLYRYDHRQRMTQKKLPGAAVETYTYDTRDRMIRKERGTRIWTYTYDNLNRLIEEKIGSIISAQYRYDAYTGTPAAPGFAAVSGFSSSYSANVTGLKTYERVAVIEGVVTRSTYVERAFYYDTKGRVIQTVERNHLGGISRYSTSYDFVGNVLASQESHQPSSSAASDTKKTTFTYDHRGRPTKEVTTLNGNSASTATVAYAYDELGKLEKKSYGTGSYALPETYTYNIQGWQTGQTSSIFYSKLRYYDPQLDAAPQYTGNIAEWEWKHDIANYYDFTYDKLGRLLNTVRGEGYSSRNLLSKTEGGITYDRNGNFMTFKRYENSSSPSDDISIPAANYRGNQIVSAINNGTSYTYTYDSNGNMTKDGLNALNLEYNYLNLTGDVKVANGSIVARYSWLADGTKTGVKHLSGTPGFEYLGSLIYQRNSSGGLVLESTGFGGGRINKTSSNYEVNYHITDHLGSVRVVFRPTSSYPTIVERNDYLPFGGRWSAPYSASSTNRHRFSGKENQTVGDLPYQDFGARFYGGKLPILTAMDPLLEDRRGMTPFAYAANNPVRYIDWMGLSPQEPNRDYQNYQVQQQAEQEAAKNQVQANQKKTIKAEKLAEKYIANEEAILAKSTVMVALVESTEPGEILVKTRESIKEISNPNEPDEAARIYEKAVEIGGEIVKNIDDGGLTQGAVIKTSIGLGASIVVDGAKNAGIGIRIKLLDNNVYNRVVKREKYNGSGGAGAQTNF